MMRMSDKKKAKMVEEGKNLNSICIFPELLEEIFLRLPLKPILKFKTVSKQWRSILESRSFLDMRMSLQKRHQKILAAYNCDCGDRPRLLHESRSEGDEEIVFLHCSDAQRASMMTCDGLLCFTERDRVIVLNPSTGQLRRFRFGPNPLASKLSCVMGFGRDKVNGSYKVVRMFLDGDFYCEILDVNIGEWRKLSPPPYKVDAGRNPEGRKPVCVNGSIYWLQVWPGFEILALNLHTLEFHDVSVPTTGVSFETQIVNLQDRLAVVNSKTWAKWKLVIWSMEAEEEKWSKTYTISLDGLNINQWDSTWKTWFRLVTVSKSGDVVFSDNYKRLYNYNPETNETRCLASDICVISPYLENLVPVRSDSGRRDLYPYIRTSRCRFLASSGISTWNPSRIVDVAYIILLVGCGLMYKKMG